MIPCLIIIVCTAPWFIKKIKNKIKKKYIYIYNYIYIPHCHDNCGKINHIYKLKEGSSRLD